MIADEEQNALMQEIRELLDPRQNCATASVAELQAAQVLTLFALLGAVLELTVHVEERLQSIEQALRMAV